MGRHASKLALGWPIGIWAGMLCTGCPIYDERDCVLDRGLCAEGFHCDARSGLCLRNREGQARTSSCTMPEDCAGFETCSEDGECRAGSCAIHGCIEGYRCAIVDEAHQCVGDARDLVDAGDASAR